MLFRRVDRELKSSLNNWNRYLKYCLPEVKGRRILNIGCKSGIYDLELAKMGANEVIGIDLNVKKALSIKNLFSKRWKLDFSNVRFVERDIVKEGLHDLGRFDFACSFWPDNYFQMIEKVSKVADTIVLQEEHIDIKEIRELLKKHGFGKMHIFKLGDYSRPVIIGEKDGAS